MGNLISNGNRKLVKKNCTVVGNLGGYFGK
jgi:hypothetical protein